VLLQVVLACALLLAAGTPGAATPPALPEPSSHTAARLPDPASQLAARLLALDPERIRREDVEQVLAQLPAPRIILLEGSIAIVGMDDFAEFLGAMGYPRERLRNPANGALAYASSVDAAALAGMLAWHFEHEAMMPMLIGHSQGGMVVIRVLHELAGAFREAIPVRDPRTGEALPRSSVIDPVTGVARPVVGLEVGYAAALATGVLPRILLGQWSIIPRLREIPDTGIDFTGFAIPWDPIAGTGPDPAPYRATGKARVRNVTLPSATSHIRIPLTRHLADDARTRQWIDRYVPQAPPPLPEAVNGENLLHAADIWWSVKRRWAIEAQRLVRATRALAGQAR
jgi:hypothetical protein